MTKTGVEHWFRCVTPWAVFAIVVKDGIIVTAAPIASWAKRAGHELISTEENDGTFRFLIRRTD